MGQDLRLMVLFFRRCGYMPLRQINSVVDHVHPIGINRGIRAQNVLTHSMRYSDHPSCGLVSGTLDKRRYAVATTELLSLPRTQRLKGVCGNHMRNIVHESRNMTGKICIPRMRMDKISANRLGCDFKINSESANRSICLRKLRQILVAENAFFSFARAIKSLNPQLINPRAKNFGQFSNVNSSSPIDMWRVFSGQQINAHVSSFDARMPLA